MPMNLKLCVYYPFLIHPGSDRTNIQSWHYAIGATTITKQQCSLQLQPRQKLIRHGLLCWTVATMMTNNNTAISQNVIPPHPLLLSMTSMTWTWRSPRQHLTAMPSLYIRVGPSHMMELWRYSFRCSLFAPMPIHTLYFAHGFSPASDEIFASMVDRVPKVDLCIHLLLLFTSPFESFVAEVFDPTDNACTILLGQCAIISPSFESTTQRPFTHIP